MTYTMYVASSARRPQWAMGRPESIMLLILPIMLLSNSLKNLTVMLFTFASYALIMLIILPLFSRMNKYYTSMKFRKTKQQMVHVHIVKYFLAKIFRTAAGTRSIDIVGEPIVRYTTAS